MRKVREQELCGFIFILTFHAFPSFSYNCCADTILFPENKI